MRQRVEALLDLLSDGGSFFVCHLAFEIGVCERTVHRYIKALRKRGYRIDGSKGRAGGVRLRPRRST
jgi:predicted DNA-binding transcriptional regulator YafY